MFKLGIIYLSYGRPELEEKALGPFISLREKNICKIAAASSIFPEYLNLIEDKETYKRLKKLKDDNKIDYLYNNAIVFSEASLRTVLLNQLLDCELIMLLDADELIDEESISKVIEFVNKFPDIYYFDMAFRNYVFDDKHYLDDIYFKRLFRNFKDDPIKQVYWDCDFEWNSGKDKDKPRMKIPSHICRVEHLSWIGEQAKNKVKYQEKHFGANFCSYKWNEQENKLEFNEKFYEMTGQPIPRVYNKIPQLTA